MKYLKSHKAFESIDETITARSFESYEFYKFINSERNMKDDLEERLRFFKYPNYLTEDIYYSVLFDGLHHVIGICKIAHYEGEERGDDPNYMSISYCSIDRDYRGKGYLNVLIEEVMKLCKRKGFTLGASRWTVPGFLKLRPTILKWAKKIGVDFNDHKKKFDHTHNYNASMVNINEMSPEELEEFQKMGNLNPRYKGFFKRIFYDTGKYKIYSTQTNYDKKKVDEIYQSVSRNSYDYFSKNGKISGYIYNGNYYITEGHYRILAALKYWRKTNDYIPVDKMIQQGNFEHTDRKPQGDRRFPSKMMEFKQFINENKDHVGTTIGLSHTEIHQDYNNAKKIVRPERWVDGKDTWFPENESIVYRGDDMDNYTGRIWVTKDLEHAKQYGKINTYEISDDLNLLYVDHNWGVWKDLLTELDPNLMEGDSVEDLKFNPTKEVINFLISKGYDGFIHGSNDENILIFDRNELSSL